MSLNMNNFVTLLKLILLNGTKQVNKSGYHTRLLGQYVGNTKNSRKSFNLVRPKENQSVTRSVGKHFNKPLLLLWTVPFLTSSDRSEVQELQPRQISQKKGIRNAIQDADELFESNKYQEATVVLLPYKESGDVEVLWRLSRAQYNWAQESAVAETDRRRLVCEAYDVISEAMAADDAHWAVHKWMSVLLDAKSTYEGIKARVSQLEKVKHHMLRAVELNPKDATTYYMLGSWCYQIADMPWIQRKIAATIFATPPTSSFEEALHFFAKAEGVQPKFYSQNLLMLGKTLLKLQRAKEAVHYLTQARDYAGSTEEDNEVRKEAGDILNSISIL